MNSGKKRIRERVISSICDQKPAKKTREINSSSKVEIGDLTRNPYQPRQNFSQEKLEELANSIKKGIIQPIAVRPKKSEKGKYGRSCRRKKMASSTKSGLHEIRNYT